MAAACRTRLKHFTGQFLGPAGPLVRIWPTRGPSLRLPAELMVRRRRRRSAHPAQRAWREGDGLPEPPALALDAHHIRLCLADRGRRFSPLELGRVSERSDDSHSTVSGPVFGLCDCSGQVRRTEPIVNSSLRHEARPVGSSREMLTAYTRAGISSSAMRPLTRCSRSSLIGRTSSMVLPDGSSTSQST